MSVIFVSVTFRNIEPRTLYTDPFAAFDVLTKLKVPLAEVFENSAIEEKLQDVDFHTLEHIVEVLRPIYICKVCNASAATELLQVILSYFRNMTAAAIDIHLHGFCSESDCASITPVRQMLQIICEVCDGKFIVPEDLKEMRAVLQPNKDIDEIPNTIENRILEFLERFPDVSITNDVFLEIQRFSCLPRVDYTDPLGWWQTAKEHFPLLARFARAAHVYPTQNDILAGDLPTLPEDSLKIAISEMFLLRVNSRVCKFQESDFQVNRKKKTTETT